MKKDLNIVYMAKRNAYNKTRTDHSEPYKPEPWEKWAKLFSWAVLIAMIILSFSK